jgi:antitoxin component YwqK of YwqJK toxin-antitoxin module
MQSKRRKLLIIAGTAALAVLGFCLFRPPVNHPSVVPGELPRASLVLTDGRMCLKEGGAPYTGKAFEQTTTGQRLTELPLVEGKIQGVVRGWYDSGQLEVEETFENSVSNGLRKRWHENGQKKNEAMVVNGELHGPYTEWHDDGTIAVRMTMQHGKGDGLCETYHRGGAVKARVTLADGKPVTQEFFPNPATDVADK